MQQLDTAKKCYELAVRLKPDYMEAENNLGTVYYARKNFRRAIGCYRRAVKMIPRRPCGVHLQQPGHGLFRPKAIPACHRRLPDGVAAWTPTSSRHHGSFGVMLQERNVEERAKFHYYMAKLYAKSGRTELALQYLRKAIEEGFKDRKKLEEDPEFAAMREMPEFKELLALEPRVL